MRQKKLVTSLMQKVARDACIEMGTTIEEIHAGHYAREHADTKCRLAVIFFEWTNFFDRPSLRAIAECIGGAGAAHSMATRWYRDADSSDWVWAEHFMAKFGPVKRTDPNDVDAEEEANARRWRDRNRGKHLGPGLYRNFCCACDRPVVVSQAFSKSFRIRCTPCVNAAMSAKSARKEVA